MEGSSNLSLTPSSELRYSSGTGYVVIPGDLERSQYINDCLVNSWISILIEGEGYYHRVPCSQDVLNSIIFPYKYDEYGSIVVWLNDPLKGHIYAISTVNNNSYTREDELEILTERHFNDACSILIKGSAKKNQYLISVTSKNTSQISFVATGNEKSKIDIRSSGIVSLYGKEIKILADELNQLIGTVEQQSLIAQNEKEILLDAEKIIFNGGKEAVVLGNILKDFLVKFIKELSETTINTSIGKMPLINKDKIVNFEKLIDDFLSDSVFVS